MDLFLKKFIVWINFIKIVAYNDILKSMLFWEKKQEMILKNTFLSWWIIFVTNMENVRKHRDITVVTAERRRDYLVSKPNYHTTKFFTEHLLVIEYTSVFRTFNTKIN